eukprot:3684552-Rhodomonas_salina.1
MARELAERKGDALLSVSLHPGVVDTNLFYRFVPSFLKSRPLVPPLDTRRSSARSLLSGVGACASQACSAVSCESERVSGGRPVMKALSQLLLLLGKVKTPHQGPLLYTSPPNPPPPSSARLTASVCCPRLRARAPCVER